jgi:hypothetical protein
VDVAVEVVVVVVDFIVAGFVGDCLEMPEKYLARSSPLPRSSPRSRLIGA